MRALLDLVRAVEDGTVTADQRAAIARLLLAVDVAVALDANAEGYTGRAHWSVAAAAYRELVPHSNVVPLPRSVPPG